VLDVGLDQSFLKYVEKNKENSSTWDKSPERHMKRPFNMPKSVLLGKDFAGNPVSIPVESTFGGQTRLSLMILGPPGSGKTKLMKNIQASVFLLGQQWSPQAICVMADPRLEQEATKIPPKCSENTPERFRPIPLPVRTYLPKYCLLAFRGSNTPKDVSREMIFEFSLKDFDRLDMETLLGLQEDSDRDSVLNARLTVREAWNIMTKDKKPEYTINDFETAVRSVPESVDEGVSHVRTKGKLIGKIKLLKGDEVISSQTSANFNPVEDIARGIIPVLSNKYSESLSYDQAYASIFGKKLFKARNLSLANRDGRIPPLWYFVDEIQAIGQSGSESARFIQYDVLRQGRDRLYNFVASTQTLYGIDTEIPNNCDNFIMFRLNRPEDLKFICDTKKVSDEDRDLILK
jgi:DNA polymerase III delta prime subunit